MYDQCFEKSGGNSGIVDLDAVLSLFLGDPASPHKVINNSGEYVSSFMPGNDLKGDKIEVGRISITVFDQPRKTDKKLAISSLVDETSKFSVTSV